LFAQFVPLTKSQCYNLLIEYLNGISSPQILGCTYVIGTPSEVCVSTHHPKQKTMQVNGLLAMAEMPSKKSGANKGGDGSPEVLVHQSSLMPIS
jgi:hypothetical protein